VLLPLMCCPVLRQAVVMPTLPQTIPCAVAAEPPAVLRPAPSAEGPATARLTGAQLWSLQVLRVGDQLMG
jgi:hypothetical protein